MSLLETIKTPADIRGYKAKQRKALAAEIREKILHTVTDTGGHLGANLGVVELTIAVHTVFETPTDQLVIDVGHQGYPHKLLTGRYNRFDTLRQHKGISGFLKRSESEYDAFGAGHAATSISAAAGMALARDILKTKEHVVCLIGDSSIPNGMSFEAMNHLGHDKSNMVVILNDNEMSISKPVGALSKYFSRIITGKPYNFMRKEVERVLRLLPFSETTTTAAHHLEEFAKSFISPGVFFEELGFTYVGPVDGHDTEALIDILTNIKSMEGPVLLHAVTRKGKGFKAAEDDPIWGHGPKGFNPETGERPKIEKDLKALKNWSLTFSDMLLDKARKDPRIVAITPAMIAGSTLDKFEKEIPDRLFDVGIAEEHAVTLAAGMATKGIRPVVCIYSTFFQRAFDQAVHDVAIQNLPVTFAFDRSGLVGDDGPTHHGVLDIAILRTVPGMVLMAPSTNTDMERMLATSISLDGPSAIRIPRGSATADEDKRAGQPLEIGKGHIRREGADACVIAYGEAVNWALEAAEDLKKNKEIDIRVIDARFAKPLDEELYTACAKAYEVMVTVEDGNIIGGFGSGVLEMLADKGLVPKHFNRLGVPDNWVEHGPQAILRDECGYGPQGIAATVERSVKKGGMRVA